MRASASVFDRPTVSRPDPSSQRATSSHVSAAADPNAVPELTAQATTHGILLTWNALPGAVRYELLAWWDAAAGWQPIGGADLTGTSYTHTTAIAGTTYYYSIRAIYAGNEGPWLSSAYPTAVAPSVTEARTATLTPTPTPTATSTSGPTPTPTATASASAELAVPELTAQTTANGILLTWETVPHAVRYELLAWWDAGTGWQPIGGADLTGTSYKHTSVTAGTAYFYSIRAVNAAGATSAWLTDYPTATAPSVTDSGTATSASTPTPTVATTDRGALVALYESTGGAGWLRNDNWLSDKPLSSWYGVRTDNNGRVTSLLLSHNRLRGELPDLSALTELAYVSLSLNELNGPIPDLSAFTSLSQLDFSHNRFSGPVFDLERHSELFWLLLHDNDLSGPLPDLSALPSLSRLDLGGNRFCLPAGASPSHANGDVDAHLKSLDLHPCSAADLAAFPPAPQNLTATAADSRVTLTWEAVADASAYDLRVWDSLERRWDALGGAPTGTSYAHGVLTDGRNYYYQVRARDAAGVRGPWSELGHAIVVPGRWPPPPASLGLHIFYQKYLEVHGVIVTAPTEVSDAKMEQARARSLSRCCPADPPGLKAWPPTMAFGSPSSREMRRARQSANCRNSGPAASLLPGWPPGRWQPCRNATGIVARLSTNSRT